MTTSQMRDKIIVLHVAVTLFMVIMWVFKLALLVSYSVAWELFFHLYSNVQRSQILLCLYPCL